MKIKDVMSKKLITCAPDDNILFVANLMNVWDVGFILVMDDTNLLGVVTDRDLVCDMANELSKISSYANTKVIKIDENSSLEDALKLMKKHKIKRLIVTNNDNVSGVLSLSDILTTKTNPNLILDTIKAIFEINRNENHFDTDINEFPL